MFITFGFIILKGRRQPDQVAVGKKVVVFLVSKACIVIRNSLKYVLVTPFAKPWDFIKSNSML